MASPFSGSYSPEDVVFLLKPIEIEPTDTLEKEHLIQAGKRHYSEMISEERLPSASYLQVFHEAMERNKSLLALHVARLACIIAASAEGEVTIVSLVRAGVPVGVMLKRVLERYLGRRPAHYCISIIRDRGIDENAILHILRREGRPQESIVFVDGWTGKGVIARELRAAVTAFNSKYSTRLSPRLHVLSDLCGQADVAPCGEDYLIPSSVLNSTISGLISRSVLNDRYIGPDDFHGCVHYQEFAGNDLSGWFVDEVSAEVEKIDQRVGVASLEAKPLDDAERTALRRRSEDFVREVMSRHDVLNVNYVKPGIGEATRVLLRRVPDRLLLKNVDMDDVRHLLVLAEEKHVPVVVDRDLPYHATALIRNMKL